MVISTSGLIYELTAGTLASYLLGDSITQFSTIIGVYLFTMGIGSYLSKYIHRDFLFHFIRLEILIGFIGGCSAMVLFILFNFVVHFPLALYTIVGITGILVGLEIPLLMRILKDQVDFKDLVSEVFTFDYIGALFASILFPLLLVPHLGIVRTSFMFGIFNVSVAIVLSFWFENQLGKKSNWLKITSFTALSILVTGFIFGTTITDYIEQMSYTDKIVLAKSSPYQRIVITKGKHDVRLYLNNNLQFSSRDEYRYHEALVHPLLTRCKRLQNIAIFGGGDGLALREVLKYSEVDQVVLVDLDKVMTDLFKQNMQLQQLNSKSLEQPRVKVYNEDAFEWLKKSVISNKKYDAVIIDFPDPTNYSVGKLYSLTFYNMLRTILTNNALVVVQSTSPYMAPKSYKCVKNTMEKSGFQTLSYHCYVPSFGDWGYIMASPSPDQNAFVVQRNCVRGLKFYSSDAFESMTKFTKDMLASHTEVQKLSNQVLIPLFEKEWSKFLE